MTFDEAIEWVLSNTGAIINDAADCLQFSPYDKEELILCANEAAIKAVFTAKESVGVKFEQAFWNHYRTLVRDILPYADNHRSSQSIPSHICVDIDEVEADFEHSAELRACDHGVNHLSEQVFWAAFEHLSPIEQRLLYKLLGMGKSGYHTLDEAGAKLGISEAGACQMFRKIRKKLSDLFSLGLASLDDLPSEAVKSEFESSLDAKFTAAA